MERRDFLVAWIHLLLISLFPWLRPKPELAQAVAEKLVASNELDMTSFMRKMNERYEPIEGTAKVKFSIRGFEVDNDWYEALQRLDKEDRLALQRDLVLEYGEDLSMRESAPARLFVPNGP